MLAQPVLDRFSPEAPQRGFGHLVALLDRLLLWQQRARSRRQLAMLNDRMLADIGISRATAEIEADRPFWQGNESIRRFHGSI